METLNANKANSPKRIFWDFGYVALQEKKLSNNTKPPFIPFFQPKSFCYLTNGLLIGCTNLTVLLEYFAKIEYSSLL